MKIAERNLMAHQKALNLRYIICTGADPQLVDEVILSENVTAQFVFSFVQQSPVYPMASYAMMMETWKVKWQRTCSSDSCPIVS